MKKLMIVVSLALVGCAESVQVAPEPDEMGRDAITLATLEAESVGGTGAYDYLLPEDQAHLIMTLRNRFLTEQCFNRAANDKNIVKDKAAYIAGVKARVSMQFEDNYPAFHDKAITLCSKWAQRGLEQ